MRAFLKRYTAMVFITLIFLTFSANISIGYALNPTAQLTADPWPMYGHDQYHTSCSPYQGTTAGNLRLFFTPDVQYYTGGYRWSPILSANGVIYMSVGTMYEGRFYALNSDGTVKWKVDVPSAPSIPAIGKDGTIYVGLRDFGTMVYAINPESGELKWSFNAQNEVNYIAIGPDDTIYFTSENGYLYALDSNGSEKWKYGHDPLLIHSYYCPAIGQDGTVYAIAAASYGPYYLYAIDSNGNFKWRCLLSPFVPNMGSTSPAIATDGIIYVGVFAYSYGGNCYAINPDGTVLWTNGIYDAPSSWGMGMPSILPDGTIIICVRSEEIIALAPNGEIKWVHEVDNEQELFPATIDCDGTIYVSSRGQTGGKLYCLNPDGTTIWTYSTESPFDSQVTIAPDGTLYIGLDGKLYAFGNVPTENHPPDNPANLAQFKSDGTTEIPVGSAISDQTAMFKAMLTDPDGDRLKLQVELRRLDELGGGFDENAGGLKESVEVASGEIATITVYGLIPADYHWRARAIDEHGVCGVWVSFGDNLDSEIDFAVLGSQPLSCVIELRRQGTTNLITEINVGEFFDIYVGDSTGDIKQVRFSSDESLDGNPTGAWKEYYWNISSEDWNATTKTKAWSFATAGNKEVWAEVEDSSGNTAKNMKWIFAVSQFTFVHMTDIHIGYEPMEEIIYSSGLLALLGNAQSMHQLTEYRNDARREELKRSLVRFADTLRNAARNNPPFILMTGDNVEWSEPNFFSAFKSILNSFIQQTENKISIYIAPGNHDRRKYPEPSPSELGHDNLENYNKYVENFDKHYFEYEGYLFIGLDSGSDALGKWEAIEELWDFLNERGPEGDGLNKSQIDYLNTLVDNKPKVIFMHHPFYTGVKDHGREDSSIINWRDDFIKYCKDNYVKLVLSGHTHKDYIFDNNGSVQAKIDTAYPYFIQTPSATKDKVLYKYGYRLFDIKTDKIDNKYIPTKSSPKIVEYLIGPTYTHIYDSQNNHTGHANGIITNIPDSYYTGYNDPSTPQIALLYRTNEEYKFEVIGTRSGTYLLEISYTNEYGKTIALVADGIPIKNGERHQYSINWEELAQNKEGVIIKVDSDGDGIFNLSITSDKDFTLLEYLDAKIKDFVTRIVTKTEDWITRNESKLIEFYIHSNLPIMTLLKWSGSELNLTLTSPSGVVMQQGISPVVEYWKGDSSIWFAIDSPEIGKWTAVIDAVDVPEEGEPYTLTVFQSNTLFAPTANAGLDCQVIIGETLQFDGSGSSDSDGTIISYKWDFGDGSIGSGIQISYTYSIAGTYTVTLVVTDDNGATGTDTMVVKVLTPAQAVDELINMVSTMNLKQGINSSLDAKLQVAKDSLNAIKSGNRNDAINKMQAFVNAVEAQKGKELTNDQANRLESYANRIIIVLGNPIAAPAEIPKEFNLAQNYPNPFNPDTWIPYQLSADTEVTIRIYDISGRLVRILDLGHKPAGFYITREKAAYWDGSNESGERVASGMYFYNIQAGDFTATRKMLMLK